MPYAVNGRVSLTAMVGAITISAAQYAEAIAGMTNRADPKQVTISDGFALDSPSLPVTQTLSITDAVQLPNVDGGGRSPVNTGLARHPSGGWLVGDDGRSDMSDTSSDPGIIWYNDSWEQVARYSLAEMEVGDDKFSVQGVVSDPRDGTFYAVGLDTDGTDTVVVQVNASTGDLVRTISVPATINGIALDWDRNHILLLSSGGNFFRHRLSDGELVASGRQVPGLTQPDHLAYLGRGKMALTYGANLSPGYVLVADISTEAVIVERLYTMTGADAIEGVAFFDNSLWICNDGAFHSGSPAENRVLRYDVTGLF